MLFRKLRFPLAIVVSIFCTSMFNACQAGNDITKIFGSKNEKKSSSYKKIENEKTFKSTKCVCCGNKDARAFFDERGKKVSISCEKCYTRMSVITLGNLEIYVED